MEASYPQLVIPLLLLSGRRMWEVLNQKSIFEPVQGFAYAAWFTGQLKGKGGSARPSYIIPLLCPYETFEYAFNVLREKQSLEPPVEDELVASHRWSANLSNALNRSKHAVPRPFQKMHVHQMRHLYMAYVYHYFTCEGSLAFTAMSCLGHQNYFGETHNYTDIKLQDCEREGLFGTLPSVFSEE